MFIGVFLGMGATRAIALSKCCVKEAAIAISYPEVDRVQEMRSQFLD
ncbi:MAG: hypothetical protein ACYTXI_04655 [Nostoc sp.]|nr:hypothetical protein [Nostoc sp. JL31]MBN3887775.1 hypothetical protein [Nostoc sp. JL31]